MNINDSMENIKRTARIAGLLYLVMFIAAPLSAMVFQNGIIIPGDAVATTSNIMASSGLFRLGIVSNLFVQILHIFLVVLLYKLLKPVNKTQAMFLAVLGLAGVPIAMLNELNQFAALILLNGTEYSMVFSSAQLNSIVAFFLNIHEYGIIIAQIFWGLWLFPLGYLIIKSKYIPKVLGILLVIGGVGYIIDVFTIFLFPNFGITISMFTFWGEVLLALWLLIKGVNLEKWRKLHEQEAT